MLWDIAIFIFGFLCGGLFVYRGMTAAIKKELLKRPWTEEEKDKRATLLVEAAKLRNCGDAESRRRLKEIEDYLVGQDVRRGEET
jgi:hypothetical protein